MILALDAGNTQIVCGCMEGQELQHIFRLETHIPRTEHEYALLLQQMLRMGGMDRESFDGAIIASVVPAVTATLKAAVELAIGVKALVVGAGIKTGLNIQIDNPAQLGSDLVVGAVAALAAYEAPLVVVDMGTAMTFTAIDAGNRLRGGAIMPGISLSLSALASGTSQLPRVAVEAPKSCIGTNTVDCMKSGAVFGTAGAIDGLLDRMEQELGSPVQVIATGQLARVITPYCRRKIRCDDHLLLRGLAIIYARNKR